MHHQTRLAIITGASLVAMGMAGFISDRVHCNWSANRSVGIGQRTELVSVKTRTVLTKRLIDRTLTNRVGGIAKGLETNNSS